MTASLSQSKKSLITTIIAIVLFIGVASVGAFYVLQSQAIRDPLYIYYPENTTFYAELAPGEQLAKRFLAMAQQQAPTPEQLSKTKAFKRALIDQFSTTFKPHISLGIWQDKQATLEDGHTLLILPLQEVGGDLSFPQLIKRFNGNPEEFKAETHANIIYYRYIGENSNFAVIDQKLFITNGDQPMEQLIDSLEPSRHRRKGKNVFDHPTNASYLKLLANGREGTLIINNTVYAEQLQKLDKLPKLKNTALPKATQQQVARFAKIMPVTVGEFEVETTNRFLLTLHSPVMISHIANKAMAKALQAAYLSNGKLKSPNTLPTNTKGFLAIRGLDKWYDLAADHLLPADQKQSLQGVSQMASFLQLDFKKDIIGLFNGEIALASTSADNMPTLLLGVAEPDKAPPDITPKQHTIDRLVSLLSSGTFFPVTHKKEQLGTVDVNTFVSSNQSTRLSIGTLKTMIGLAETTQFTELADVNGKKKASLWENPEFKNMSHTFPKEVLVQFYANLPGQSLTKNPIGQALEQKNLGKKINASSADVKTVAGAIWAKNWNSEQDMLEARLVVELMPLNK